MTKEYKIELSDTIAGEYERAAIMVNMKVEEMLKVAAFQYIKQ